MPKSDRHRWEANPRERRPRVGPASQAFHGTYIPSHMCMCGRKGYVSRKDAKTVKREMERNYPNRRHDTVAVYRCFSDDRNWHVGTPPNSDEMGNHGPTD